MNHSEVIRVNKSSVFSSTSGPRSTVILYQEQQTIEIPIIEKQATSPQTKKHHKLSGTTNHSIPFKIIHTQSTLPFLIQGEQLLMMSMAPISDRLEEDFVRSCDFPGDQGLDRPETELEREEDIQLKIPSDLLPPGRIKNTNRKDMYNTPISSNTKTYRVTFRDQVTPQKIKDIHIVQNWKSHYRQDEEDDDSCCCNIF